MVLMKNIVTKKPDKIRTHSRYVMQQRLYKIYTKCNCGSPLILVNDIDTTCKCGNKFTGGYGISQPGGQNAVWPKHLKRFCRPGKNCPIDAGYTLDSSVFNLGRVTKRMLAEIVELGGEVSTYYTQCIDGRKHIDSLTISFHLYTPKELALDSTVYFNIHPEYRNNKKLNERVFGFLSDLRDIKKFLKDDNGIKELSKWNAPNACSEETVVLKTMKKYEY